MNVNHELNDVLDSVNDSGYIVKDEHRHWYKCPVCGGQVYVVKGAPYRGECVDCLKKRGAFGKTIASAAGFVSYLSEWF